MAIGATDTQVRFEDAATLLGDRLTQGSLYRLLAEHGHRLFPDDYLADLYSVSLRGRPTIPARVIATVMLLQSFEGLSDREACDRLAFDLRWQAAAGVAAAADPFHPTVLVGVRNRLRASDRPRRLFEDTVAVAKRTGVVSTRIRVFDSTPLLDAVATQDTVTQLRAQIRRVLKTAPAPIAARIRAALRRDDDYAAPGKPPCDWDDAAARESLVDQLATDALAALGVLEGEALTGELADATELLGVVAGQDLEQGPGGTMRIARGVARGRVISTVDPQARHGHKSRNRRFDGYKTHIAIEPDSEIITAVSVTPANTPDRDQIDALTDEGDTDGETPAIMGDSAYADGATLERMAQAGREIITKVPPVRNPKGISKDLFQVDVAAGTVTCPAQHTVAIQGGKASFAARCGPCPLRPACTTARKGRTISINEHEAALQAHKRAQTEPGFIERYRAIRPKVERKIAHLVRRPWGGRKARCRGLERIATDVATRAGVVNLARLAVLGLHPTPTGWATT